MSAETPPRIELAILAKAPVPGFAKTRLIPHLGREGAAALQRWLLQRRRRLRQCHRQIVKKSPFPILPFTKSSYL